ncbi:hypothetical protein Taro_055359 [Colocasia esculenta]|uniref:Uncharacterized protein n=1 Tax=Colocasia esculenta TaxID=4460 RepID=A0A843XR70_COLES|nr:hypothetical protein [Colocasia esculenta]
MLWGGRLDMCTVKSQLIMQTNLLLPYLLKMTKDFESKMPLEVIFYGFEIICWWMRTSSSTTPSTAKSPTPIRESSMGGGIAHRLLLSIEVCARQISRDVSNRLLVLLKEDFMI